MSTSYPKALDNSRSHDDAIVALETRVGIEDSTDPDSLTYQLSSITPTLPHRSDVTAYVSTPVGATVGSKAMTAGTVYAVPFYVPTTNTYLHVGVLRTAVAATAKERLGVYADAGGIPGDLLADWGEVPATATTGFKSRQISTSLTGPRWVWLACCPQTALNTLLCTVGTSTGSPVVVATRTPHTTGITMGYAGQTAITSGLATSWGSTYTERAVVPVVFIARA